MKTNKNIVKVVVSVLVGSVFFIFLPLLYENGDFEYWMTRLSEKMPAERKARAERQERYEKYLSLYSDSTQYLAEKEQIARSFAMNIDSVRSIILSVPNDNPDSAYKYARPKIYDPLKIYVNLSFCDTDKNATGTNQVIIPDSAAVFYDIQTKGLVMSKDGRFCIAFISIHPNEENDYVYERQNFFFPVIGYREGENENFKIYPRFDEYTYIMGWDEGDMTDYGIRDFVAFPENHASNIYDVFLDDYGSSFLSWIFPKSKKKAPAIYDSDYFDQPLFQKYNDSTYNFQWYKDFRPGPLGKYAEAEKDLEVRQFHYPY